MRLILSLSADQKDNLESDFGESRFFKFHKMYPGYRVEKLKIGKLPMLYYNDNIPDLELCKPDKTHEESEIDATAINIWNEYATKMLLLFFPFCDKKDFPTFDDRWKFLHSDVAKETMYWDSERLIQNLQDVENSKKIISVQDEVTKKTNILNFTPNDILDYRDDVDDDEVRIENEANSLIFQNDEVDLDLIVEDFGVYEQISQGEYLGNNVVGCLNSEMKDIHIISFTIHQKSSVILHEEERSDCPETEIVGMLPSRTQFSDVVKTVLNLDVNNENEVLNWDKNSEDTDFFYADISLPMKNCIQYFNLDPKQAAAFTVICSSFMLTYLNDPTIAKYGSQVEKENATRILLEKSAKSRLIMHLTGSSGSGKSFVLKAIKSFCKHFCRAIGQPFDESVLIISATTNTAAAQVQGDTIHSLASL